MNAENEMQAKPSTWRVLIVDDESFVASVLGEMMSGLGAAEVLYSANGKEAIQFLASCKTMPELILCDLHMPGKDGFQLMEELARRQYQGGLVLVSGQQNHVLHSASVMARFHQLNILGVLEKPASVEQLREVVEKMQAAW